MFTDRTTPSPKTKLICPDPISSQFPAANVTLQRTLMCFCTSSFFHGDQRPMSSARNQETALLKVVPTQAEIATRVLGGGGNMEGLSVGPDASMTRMERLER
uniref:Uncharacterized protein n=1 Tax=Steinernema glaseri TaxID=37863 RepID=A0A1I7YKP0_9BILA